MRTTTPRSQWRRRRNIGAFQASIRSKMLPSNRSMSWKCYIIMFIHIYILRRWAFCGTQMSTGHHSFAISGPWTCNRLAALCLPEHHPYNSHHTFSMLLHYFAKVRSSSFGISERTCTWKCNMRWFLNTTQTILMHLTYLLISSKQVLWTETAFSACLAWHWPDHHWQGNWRVVWTSSHMSAGKRWTLWATIVTTFSHMTRGV